MTYIFHTLNHWTYSHDPHTDLDLPKPAVEATTATYCDNLLAIGLPLNNFMIHATSYFVGNIHE